jgi:hypothetical protein
VISVARNIATYPFAFRVIEKPHHGDA